MHLSSDIHNILYKVVAYTGPDSKTVSTKDTTELLTKDNECLETHFEHYWKELKKYLIDHPKSNINDIIELFNFIPIIKHHYGTDKAQDFFRDFYTLFKDEKTNSSFSISLNLRSLYSSMLTIMNTLHIYFFGIPHPEHFEHSQKHTVSPQLIKALKEALPLVLMGTYLELDYSLFDREDFSQYFEPTSPDSLPIYFHDDEMKKICSAYLDLRGFWHERISGKLILDSKYYEALSEYITGNYTAVLKYLDDTFNKTEPKDYLEKPELTGFEVSFLLGNTLSTNFVNPKFWTELLAKSNIDDFALFLFLLTLKERSNLISFLNSEQFTRSNNDIQKTILHMVIFNLNLDIRTFLRLNKKVTELCDKDDLTSKSKEFILQEFREKLTSHECHEHDSSENDFQDSSALALKFVIPDTNVEKEISNITQLITFILNFFKVKKHRNKIDQFLSKLIHSYFDKKEKKDIINNSLFELIKITKGNQLYTSLQAIFAHLGFPLLEKKDLSSPVPCIFLSGLIQEPLLEKTELDYAFSLLSPRLKEEPFIKEESRTEKYIKMNKAALIKYAIENNCLNYLFILCSFIYGDYNLDLLNELIKKLITQHQEKGKTLVLEGPVGNLCALTLNSNVISNLDQILKGTSVNLSAITGEIYIFLTHIKKPLDIKLEDLHKQTSKKEQRTNEYKDKDKRLKDHIKIITDLISLPVFHDFFEEFVYPTFDDSASDPPSHKKPKKKKKSRPSAQTENPKEGSVPISSKKDAADESPHNVQQITGSQVVIDALRDEKPESADLDPSTTFKQKSHKLETKLPHEAELTTALAQQKLELQAALTAALAQQKLELQAALATALAQQKSEHQAALTAALAQQKLEHQAALTTALAQQKLELQNALATALAQQKAENDASFEHQRTKYMGKLNEKDEKYRQAEENQLKKAVIIALYENVQRNKIQKMQDIVKKSESTIEALVQQKTTHQAKQKEKQLKQAVIKTLYENAKNNKIQKMKKSVKELESEINRLTAQNKATATIQAAYHRFLTQEGLLIKFNRTNNPYQ